MGPKSRVELSGCGLKKNRATLTGMISSILICFVKAKRFYLKMSVIFIFAIIGRGLSTKYCVLQVIN